MITNNEICILNLINMHLLSCITLSCVSILAELVNDQTQIVSVGLMSTETTFDMKTLQSLPLTPVSFPSDMSVIS